MLPLSEATVTYLLFAAIFGAVAAVVARGRPIRLWAVAVLLVVSLAWPWGVAALLGLNRFLMQLAVYYGLWSLGVVIAGLVWGYVLRRFLPGRAALAVALTLPLLPIGWLLERQRVPDALCAERASFAVGDLVLTIPREIGARSRVGDDDPFQLWQGEYGAGVEAKSQVRALCRATDGGRKPVPVTQLSLPAGDFSRAVATDCLAGRGATELCAASGRMALSVVQLHDRADGMPGLTLGLFDPVPIRAAIAAGERQGWHCNEGGGIPGTRYCHLWQTRPDGPLALIAARLGPEVPGEDPQADAAILLDAFLESFAPTD